MYTSLIILKYGPVSLLKVAKSLCSIHSLLYIYCKWPWTGCVRNIYQWIATKFNLGDPDIWSHGFLKQLSFKIFTGQNLTLTFDLLTLIFCHMASSLIQTKFTSQCDNIVMIVLTQDQGCKTKLTLILNAVTMTIVHGHVASCWFWPINLVHNVITKYWPVKLLKKWTLTLMW